MESMRYKSLLNHSKLFQPDPSESEYLEIWEDTARGLGQGGPCNLTDGDIGDFVNRQGAFRVPQSLQGKPCIRLIFAHTVLATLTTNTRPRTGELFRAGPTPKLPFSPTAFDKLVRGCKIPFQILETHQRHSKAGCGSKFIVLDESSGKVLSFLLMVRLQTSLVSLAAFSHNMRTGVTTGIILQAGEDGTQVITTALAHYRSLIGQPLLLPTILVDIGLAGSIEQSLLTKSTLDYIEDATRQHTFAEFIVSSYETRPTDITFEERMKLAHGSKIEIAVAQRKVRVLLDLVDLLHQTHSECHGSPTLAAGVPAPGCCEIKDWIDYLGSQTRMEATDADFLMQRAENQISAIYALQSQMIAKATKRDSSAMKSLAFLSALFFPGTFIAAIFSLEPMRGQTLRTYWAITIPLTILTLCFWFGWTLYRAHVYRETNVFRGADFTVRGWRGTDTSPSGGSGDLLELTAVSA
ncbi:MAG: hypothetical protein M1839_004553 [Geoglossum umbratile]|nr:MAG: hypothetical protein M1839_004553 [Geoglossum umbratile]